MKFFFPIFALLSISLSFVTSAFESDEVDISQWNFSLYLGEAKIENPLIKQDDLDINFFASVNYYGDKFFIDGTTVGYSLFETENLLVDAVGTLNEDGLFFHFNDHKNYTLVNILGFKPNSGGVRDVDLNGFDAIDRNISYLAGVNVSFMNEYFTTQVAFLNDITGVHGGNEVRLSFSKNITFSWFEFFLEFGQVEKSEQLVKYYYEFQPSELSFLKSNYEGKSTINRYFKMQLDIPITHSLTFMALVKKTNIGNSIKESFIVDKDTYSSSFVGLRYTF